MCFCDVFREQQTFPTLWPKTSFPQVGHRFVTNRIAVFVLGSAVDFLLHSPTTYRGKKQCITFFNLCKQVSALSLYRLCKRVSALSLFAYPTDRTSHATLLATNQSGRRNLCARNAAVLRSMCWSPPLVLSGLLFTVISSISNAAFQDFRKLADPCLLWYSSFQRLVDPT